MLYERWLLTLEKHEEHIAMWHPDAPSGLTFKEIHQKSLVFNPAEHDRISACGYEIDFFPKIIAGWRTGIPLILKESLEMEISPVRCPIPSETVLIKQSCGASGVERSLFFGSQQIISEAEKNYHAMALSPERRGIAAISISHSYGFGCLALPLLFHGVPVEVIPTPLPMFLRDSLTNGGPCFLPGVPALWKHWWKAGILSSDKIDLAVSAGSVLTGKLEQDIWDDTGIKLHSLYGSSETGAISYDNTDKLRTEKAAVGKLVAGVEMKISGEGRVCVKSDGIATGSDHDLHPNEFTEPFYKTWDLVEQEGDQLLWLGCEGCAINSAGRKVSPAKIERVCESISGVVQARVEGIPCRDEERFQSIKISVELDESTTLKKLKASLYDRLESWEMPRKWEETTFR